MSIYSIIHRSQLEGTKRLDAKYYQPEYLEIDSAMKQHQPLKMFAEKIFSGPFGSTLKSESYQDAGIPFIRIGDISDVFIETKGLVYISESEHRRIHSTHLKPGDIVLSKIGTVGRLSVIPEELGEVNISENNIGLRLSNLSHAQKAFLLIFLLGRFGQRQLIRKASGNIQLKLNVSDVEEIKIPTVPSSAHTQICQMYDQVIEQIHRSTVLYSQAEQMLLKELELEDFEEDGDLWNIVRLSDVKAASRMDAEYFQPKYDELFRLLEKHSARPLGEIVTMKKGIEPGSEAYTDEGKLFIRVSNISRFGLADKDQKYLSDRLYKELKDDYVPKVGEILLTKDASPGVACVLMEKVEGVISGGVLRLKLKESMDAEYLAFCINSLVGRLQAERDAGGSIIAHWKPEQIKEVRIPVLPETTQKRIAELVRASHAARSKARELLEEAKRTVEEWVERGDGGVRGT